MTARVPFIRLWAWLAVAVALAAGAPPAWSDQTLTLVPRPFAAESPAAPFQRLFGDARRLAANTTPAWRAADGDLAAWGPALVFALLDRLVPAETVLALAAPLESDGTAPILMFRTLGLYAAKSRVPFAATPTLMQTVNRNLHTLERATRDLEALTSARELSGWGSIGAGAWLAFLELLYRDYFELADAGAGRWTADGVRIVDELLERGRMLDGTAFRADPRDERITLWPNVLALYALVKSYETTELVKYESAAIAAVRAIDALRAEDGSYFSTTAKDERNPRANAYLAGALLWLFKDTGDVQYRERALAVLRWLTSVSAAQDADTQVHAGYLVLLLDSLAMQPAENIFGRRPMRVAGDPGVPPESVVASIASRLHPADFRYREMFDGVLHNLLQRTPHSAGDFAYDYGDSPGYAAAVLLNGGEATSAAPIVQRQERLLAWPRPRDFDEISFGAGALFAAVGHPEAVDAGAAERALRRYVLLSGGLAFIDRYYFDWLDWVTGGGGFDYGPTVIGAQIAAAQLRFAEHFGDARVAAVLRPMEVARAVIAAADRLAWDADRHVYRARPQNDTVWLLPNMMMVLDLLEAYEVTREPAYRERAEDVGRGVEVLWDETRQAYCASSEQTGDNAYESLSTNTYAALALLRLAQVTQTPAYRDRALAIFDFMHRDLYAGGILYHHLYRGRRAAGDIWCSGCNWRVLQALDELAKPQQ